MKNSIFLPLIAAILFVAMITVNVLANALPINGLDTGEVSDRYPSLFTPSGITFSIWSVIYFFLGGCVVVMWTDRTNAFIRKLLPLFCASCILNISWILAWHYLLPGLSVVIMLALLFVLIIIFITLTRTEALDKPKKIWVRFPFTIYLAWISVATIANISAYLVSLGWDGSPLSEQTWAVIMMFIAAALAFYVTITYEAYWYSAVVIWALIGIFLKRQGSEFEFIVYTSIALAVVLAVNVFYRIRKTSHSVARD
jgi:tryptophan-rich sensory protein